MYDMPAKYFCIKLFCLFILFVSSVPVFVWAGTTQILNVKKFGAKGDGISDDTRFIQDAINAAVPGTATTIFFPKGVYRIASWQRTANYLENYSLLIKSNLLFTGEGKASIIRIANHVYDAPDTMANAHVFYGVDIADTRFENLSIDMNGANNLVPKGVIKNHTAIFIYLGRNVSISQIWIKNCAGCNMIDIKGDGHKLLIEKCTLLNGGNYVGTPIANEHQFDFSFIYSEWDSTTVQQNTIEQQNIEIALANYTGGIEMHGSNSVAQNNVITGCFPGIYITSSRGVLTHMEVAFNQFSQCLKGVSLWVMNPMQDINIHDNTIELTHSRRLVLPSSAGIEIPNGNASEYSAANANNGAVSGLRITGNKINSVVGTDKPDKSSGIMLHSVQQSSISGNTITGMNYGGIVLSGSKWGMKDVSITGNIFEKFQSNPDKQAVAGYIVVTDTYSPGKKSAPGFKNVLLEKNQFIRIANTNSLKAVAPAKPGGQFIGAFIALPQASLPEIRFEKNTFSSPGESVLKIKTD